MTKSISAQGFTLDSDQTALINKKLERISYAENLIVDLIMHVKEDKKFYFDTTVNFRWGGNAHVTGDDFDFAAARVAHPMKGGRRYKNKERKR